jgi:ribose transport system substrate-binding protein
MRLHVDVRAGTALVLAAIFGTGALFTGRPSTVTASHAGRGTAQRTVRSLRMEVIVKSSNAANDSYSQVILAGARRAAAQFGVQSLGFTGADADNNVAGQIRLMGDAIARHPDFIVLVPTSTLLAPVITRAYRAGIKVIILDAPPHTSNYQSYLATNMYKGSCRAANTLAAAIKAKTGRAAGQIAYETWISVPNGQLIARRKGFTDCIAHYPGIHIVRHVDAGADPNYAQSIAANTLTAFPHLVGFYADTFSTLNAAAQAFVQRKVDHKRMSLVGWDGEDQVSSDLAAHRLDGVVLQDPYQMGYGGVAYGILAAAGLSVPKYVDSGAVVATPANVNSPLIQGLLNPSQRRLGF